MSFNKPSEEQGTEKVQLRKPQFIKVKDIEQARNGYNVIVKIVKVQKDELNTKEGVKIPTVHAVVADETGCSNAFFKGEDTKLITQGKVIAIRNGVKRIFKSHISLQIDAFGRVTPQSNDIKPSQDHNISEKEVKQHRNGDRDRDRGSRGRRGGRRGNNRPRNFNDRDRQYDRPARNYRNDNERDRGYDRRQRNDRNQRPYRNDQNDRNDGNYRNDRNDRNYRNDRNNRNYRDDRVDTNYRGDRGDRNERYNRNDRNDRNDRSERYDRNGGRDERTGGRDERTGGRDERAGGRDERTGDRDERNGGRDERTGGRNDRNNNRSEGNNYRYERNDKYEGNNRNQRNDRRPPREQREKDRDFDRKPPRQNRRQYEERAPKYERREQDRERKPVQFVKINEIGPGQDQLNLIAKVISLQQVAGRKVMMRAVLGDSTGIISAFLPESQHLVKGASVCIFDAEAKVVREHVELQVHNQRKIVKAKREVNDVDTSFNLSEKSWVPVD